MSNTSFSQIIDSKEKSAMEKTSFVSIYKINRTSEECSEQKNATLFQNGTLSPCFQLKKKLNREEISQVIKIFLNANSLKTNYEDCFTSDFGMIFYDPKKKIVAYFTMSLSCGNISLNNQTPMTLTNAAGEQLRSIIQ